ncbi:putative VQ motif-containing protein [Arabidopsis thaliana]
MASSEGLASVDPWSFRQNFNIDSWLLSDSFSHDSDILAKALHRSISTSTESSPLSPSSFFDSSTAAVDFSPPQTLSNVSFGSDPEIPAASALGLGNENVVLVFPVVNKRNADLEFLIRNLKPRL